MIKVLNVKSLYSALYGAVEFCKQHKQETIEIIVPDKLSLFMEKFLFEHMNITASFNIKVSTLNRFSKKTCSVDRASQISKVGSILLIYKILNQNLDKLEVMKNKAYSFSYAEVVLKTIEQLKASKIGWEEMKGFSSSDQRLELKIKDLAFIYEEYEKGKAGLLDASDLFLMTTLSVAKGKEGARLLFVGFDDFTAIEYSIIERLALVAEVNVFNYASKEGNKFLYNQEVVSQLRNIAYINELPFQVEDYAVEITQLKEFLENNIYSLQNEKFTLEDEVVKIFSGNNVADEIEFVARDIRTKILDGDKFSSFGVAVFGLENHENKIKEIFNKYDINYYLDSKISLTKSVLYKFFTSVLKYNLDGYALYNIIDIINSEFLLLEKEVKRNIVQQLISLQFRGKVISDINLDIDEDSKNLLVDFMNLVTFEKNIGVCEVVEKFTQLYEQLNFDNVLTEIANQDIDNVVLLRKSKDVLFSLFDDMIKFYSDMDLNSFYDILTHVASVVTINNLPLSLDSVKVVDASNSMEVFEELYMIGVTHDNAPLLKHDCGIILDNDIERLSFSHKLSPTIAHINKLSKLRLFNVFMLFEKELTITYSNSPSELIKELTNRLQVNTLEGIKNIVPISKYNFGKYKIISKWDLFDFIHKNNNKIKNKLEINEKFVKNKDFSYISKENLNIFNNFNNVSATMLENYFKCPFMAFLSNTLKIKPNMKNEILSLDIGNVLHEIMFKFYQQNKQVGDVYEFCKKEVFKCVDRQERLKLNADSPILINLIGEAVRVVNALNYIDENSEFQPKFFEYDFSGDKSLKLKNILVSGKVDRVDVCNDMFRVVDYKSGKADASLKELYYGNKLQLFLYSCAMENVLKKKCVGSFYLPLHNAYTRELGNTYSLKGFYLAEDFVVHAFDKRLEAGMKSDIVNVKLNKSGGVTKTIGYKELDINSLNGLKDYAKTISENAVEEIKSGYIAPSPSDVSKPCEYCPYVHICMKNSNNLQYRQSKKINLDSFKEEENEGV